LPDAPAIRRVHPPGPRSVCFDPIASPTALPAVDFNVASELPALTNAAVESARWNPEVGCLIDTIYPGRPLLVTFGFLGGTHLPLFDFFGRSKKLEKRFNLKLNRILIRDCASSWYHRGVPGLGTHIDAVAATLRGMIRAVRPSRVMTIGQSMGGYAAILFGMLAGVDRIIAFGPLAHLNPARARCEGDLRFISVMDALAADRPRSGYYDLVELGRALDYRAPIQVVFGTHPGHDDGLSGNLDSVHAFSLARLSNVVLHPYHESQHPVVEWLVKNKQIDDLLARFLIDEHDLIAAGPDSNRLNAEAMQTLVGVGG
jgi:pimeloyl-ACP methyl ester carboxylesterase